MKRKNNNQLKRVLVGLTVYQYSYLFFDYWRAVVHGTLITDAILHEPDGSNGIARSYGGCGCRMCGTVTGTNPWHGSRYKVTMKLSRLYISWCK